jgi:hypothetical protein
MTEPRLVLLLAWKIAEILNKSRPGDDCTPFAQDVILEVAAWLRKRNVRVRASVEIAGDLEREINQAQPDPEGPTDEDLLAIAAALRTAADQVEQKWRGLGHEACQEIRAIADELKA